MALSDTFTPQQFYFSIQQGAHFHLEFSAFVDAATGEPFDFTAEAWVAKMDVKTKDGSPVCSFATSGENGTITLRSDGTVGVDLRSQYTSALTPTVDYQSNAGPSPVYADLVLIDPTDSEPWVWFTGKGQIRKQVTD